MHILLLTDNYPPEVNANALRSSHHARRWVEQGHQVTVVTSFPNFPEGRLHEGYRQRLNDRRMVDGVSVVRVPTLIYPNSALYKRIMDFTSYMVSAGVQSLFVERPDIVVATSPHLLAAVAGWFVSVARRRPFVFELRDLWPDSIVAVGAMKDSLPIRLLRRLEYFLYRRADRIVAVTESFRTHLSANGIDPAKIALVRNGANTQTFVPGSPPPDLRGRLGIEENAIVISYIGTIGMAQGLDILVDVAAILAERVPEVCLLVVGTGAERERLREAGRKRGLKNLIFAPAVSHGEVVDYWRLSDATLVILRDSPVFRTVIPSKVFEAMATGTPIITNVRGELDTLLEPLGTAVAVRPDDAPALADAIEDLARDSDKRLRLAAAGVRSAALFHRDRQADLMLELLLQTARR